MADDTETDHHGRSLTGGLSMTRSEASTFDREEGIRRIGTLRLRGKTDNLPQDWWFASTAIPLLAATIGPMANVLSIVALVSTWRVTLPNNGQLPEGTDDAGINIPDPHWEVILNAISLACGFFGNFCLLLNFTRRVRYIVALPLTIIAWYFASGILIGIIVAMNKYVPPVRPGETYSQGFWHAIIAAVLYLITSMLLMVNMLGYFLGHYPQHFDLDDDQRTLILQTMMFFIWLAGGAGIFSRLCGFSFADALYFSDVTVLTIGFGDIIASNDGARGFIFPFAVIGIIFLGLMINSIRKFATSMSKEKVIKAHQLHERERTFGRSVTSEKELRERLGLPPRRDSDARRPSTLRKQSTVGTLKERRTSLEQYGHFDVHGRTITFHEHKSKAPAGGGGRGGAGRSHKPKPPLSRDAKMQMRAAGKDSNAKRRDRREKLILLKEEKDRFDAMREIQSNTSRFKQYYALAMSVLAFGILWCVGAAIFMVAERRIQDLSYFESLYFCYVSLLTIGYGDFAPKSNAGKPFFIVWSLVAVPTMTILVSDMGDTVVAAVNRGTFTLADWTVMPKAGVWHDFLEKHPQLKEWLERKTKEREAKKRIAQGFGLQNPDEEGGAIEEPELKPTLEKLAEEPPEQTEHELARKLAIAIKRVANDLRLPHAKKYGYEEWVEFTRLIRFSKNTAQEVVNEEEEEGLVEWDWIGEDSPMLADVSESEWILDRLCESLNRYTRKMAKDGKRAKEFQENQEKRYGSRSPDAIADLDFEHQDKPHYPAHPGPRSSHSRLHRNPDSGASTVSPVLSRGLSGEQQVQAHHRKKEKRKQDERVLEGREVGSSEGEGSGTTAVDDDSPKLEDEFGGREVREWATRVNSRGDELDAQGNVVSPASHDFDHTVLGHG
ncbi:voltage-gated potassium channel [Hyaloscypha variabilis F]|uniref:Voltage-gated potassium channel n=1 Tax=Hyaloscypha variabilis (strain UAMH 11265 / GT02V1 / F) TaxID=1149755 RepID=A0A2J6SA07_HYAVF|nr:voltage-gated potassium channel [Hyaloscypha variabilis F]